MAFVKYFMFYAVCAAALAVLVYGADSYRCVMCSDYDTCADKVDTEKVKTTCNTTADQVCERYSFQATNGSTLTVRKCTEKKTTCDNEQETNKGNMKDNSTWLCYTCETDLCNKENSAGSIGVSVVSMVATVLISLYMK